MSIITLKEKTELEHNQDKYTFCLDFFLHLSI